MHSEKPGRYSWWHYGCYQEFNSEKGRGEKASSGGIPSEYTNYFAISAKPNRSNWISNSTSPATLFKEIIF